MNDRRLVEAHGEWKTLTAWARDKRCVVTVNTLRARLAAGWSLEDAMATPPWRHGRQTLTAKEVTALKAAADLVRSLPHVHPRAEKAKYEDPDRVIVTLTVTENEGSS